MNTLYHITLQDLVSGHVTNLLLTAANEQDARAQAIQNMVRDPEDYEVANITAVCRTADSVDTEI